MAITIAIDSIIAFSPIPSISETDQFNVVKAGLIGIVSLIGAATAGYLGRTVEPEYAPKPPKAKRTAPAEEYDGPKHPLF